MTTRTTFFLAMVSLGLLIYLVVIGFKGTGTRDKNLDQDRLFPIVTEAIDRLEILNTDGNYTFSKSLDGVWAMESPAKFPADQNSVATLIAELEHSRRLATLDRKQLPDWDQALETFGLSPMKKQLRIRQNNEFYQLTFGKPTSREKSVYVLINSGKTQEIIIVDKQLEAKLDQGLDNWRSRKIFEFLPEDVRSLTLRKGGAETELLKDKLSLIWTMTKPLVIAADESEVSTLLANLSSAQVQGFVADNALDIAAYGLSSPTLALDIKFGEKTETLRIGGELSDQKGTYYAQLESRPNVFKINTKLYQTISGIFEKVRDKRILTLSSKEEVTQVKIEKEELMLTLRQQSKAPSEWVIDLPEERMADVEKIQTLIESLKKVRANSFLPDDEAEKKKQGLNKPALKITLLIKDEKGVSHEKVLLFSSPKKGVVSILTPYSTNILTLPEEQIPIISILPHEWFGKLIKIYDPKVTRSITWEKANQTFSLSKDKDWPQTVGTQKVDQAIFQRQLELLASIPLKDWSLQSEKSFGPRYLRLTILNGEKPIVLEIGKELGDGLRLARFQGESIAFSMIHEDCLLLELIPLEVPAAVEPAAPK